MADDLDPDRIRQLYADGRNIMAAFRDPHGVPTNSETAILWAYDLQAGRYTRYAESDQGARTKRLIAQELLAVLAPLQPASLLDAGTGEATTLAPLLQIWPEPCPVLACDISLSRLLFARRHLAAAAPTVSLFTAGLGRLPLATGSVDVVTTFHAVEPNGGREDAILAELVRVARRYLVLVEPDRAFAPPAAVARMAAHGYASDLPARLASLGATVERHERWPVNSNPLNPAGLIVARIPSRPQATEPQPTLVSPVGRTRLDRRDGYLFAPEEGLVFPIIEGVACLLPSNAIIAQRLSEALG